MTELFDLFQAVLWEPAIASAGIGFGLVSLLVILSGVRKILSRP